MAEYQLYKLKNSKHKFLVVTPTGKKIRFGASGYEDYTTHRDKNRKENYIKRHSVREDWKDLNKAGTWSRYILWNKPTIQGSIKDMEKLFGIIIN